MKKTAGQRLAEIRNTLQLSQEQMAKLCSLTPVTFSRIENMSAADGDKYNRSLLQIARTTGINDNYLLSGTGEVWDTGTAEQNFKRIRDLIFGTPGTTAKQEWRDEAYTQVVSERDRLRNQVDTMQKWLDKLMNGNVSFRKHSGQAAFIVPAGTC